MRRGLRPHADRCTSRRFSGQDTPSLPASWLACRPGARRNGAIRAGLTYRRRHPANALFGLCFISRLWGQVRIGDRSGARLWRKPSTTPAARSQYAQAPREPPAGALTTPHGAHAEERPGLILGLCYPTLQRTKGPGQPRIVSVHGSLGTEHLTGNSDYALPGKRVIVTRSDRPRLAGR